MKFRIILLSLASAGLASATSYTNYSSTQFTRGTFLDFNVTKFDSNLGTLTGVTVVVTSANLVGSSTVKNTSDSTVGVNAIADTFFVTTSSAVEGFSDVLGYTDGLKYRSNVATTPTQGSVSIAPGDTQTLTIDPGQITSFAAGTKTQVINPAYFSAYQSAGGTGSETFKAQNIFAITTTGGTYEVNSDSVGVNTQFAVTYTYTAAIPETSSALLGGLGTLVLLRRRRL